VSFYICSNCGYGSGSWIGKCPDCGQWNTLVEQREDRKGKKEPLKKIDFVSLEKVKPLSKERKKTGVYELDRVLGGGIVKGEVVLLTGEPGVGKSTLLLQSLQELATLYISGEESGQQVKERAERLSVRLHNFLFSETLQVEGIVEGVSEMKRNVDVLVIDSIQTVYSREVESTAGSITQLKGSLAQLIKLAKSERVAVIVIGHITKEGEIAGPKALEHMVDCVLSFEGEKNSHFRLLRALKNRFGPTDEIGIFEMKKGGLTQVDNPLIFLDRKDEQVGGKAIIGASEGNRTLFFEIQTLAVPTRLAIPRRVVKGLDYNKVLLLLAVAKKYLGLSLDSFDVYVNVIGGVSVKSTSSDLGVIASLISSIKNKPLPRNTLFVGEVGLLGEIRRSYFEEKIISESKRLGFKTIYSFLNIDTIKHLKKLLI